MSFLPWHRTPVRGTRLPLWTALSRPLSAVTAAFCLNEGGFGLDLKAVPQPNSRQLMLVWSQSRMGCMMLPRWLYWVRRVRPGVLEAQRKTRGDELSGKGYWLYISRGSFPSKNMSGGQSVLPSRLQRDRWSTISIDMEGITVAWSQSTLSPEHGTKEQVSLAETSSKFLFLCKFKMVITCQFKSERIDNLVAA